MKCMGSVRAGERVYATVDLDNPGTAIPESHLPPSVVLGKTSILLGMSMEEKKVSKLDDVNLVECFVCIVLGVNDKAITAEIENMYDHFEMDLAVKLRRERKKTRRREYHDIQVVVLPPAPNRGKNRMGAKRYFMATCRFFSVCKFFLKLDVFWEEHLNWIALE